MAIGTGYSYAYSQGANADAGAINASESGARNLAYASSNTDIRSMTGSLLNADQPVGGLMCLSGAFSGWLCGYVVHTNVDVTVGGKLIHHMWETQAPGHQGDSGGTMMVNYKWAGTYSAFNAASSFYTTRDWVITALSVYPCIVSNC